MKLQTWWNTPWAVPMPKSSLLIIWLMCRLTIMFLIGSSLLWFLIFVYQGLSFDSLIKILMQEIRGKSYIYHPFRLYRRKYHSSKSVPKGISFVINMAFLSLSKLSSSVVLMRALEMYGRSVSRSSGAQLTVLALHFNLISKMIHCKYCDVSSF